MLPLMPAQAPRPALPPSSDTAYWSRFRRPVKPSDLILLPDSLAWLDRLPAVVAPRALAAQYPRIVNQLVLRLTYPAELADYVDSLLVDRRGGRRGFPADVLRDLVRLHEHFRRIGAYGRGGFSLAPVPGAQGRAGAAARNRHAEFELHDQAARSGARTAQRCHARPVAVRPSLARCLFSFVLQFQR
jgi:hypothetical protein